MYKCQKCGKEFPVVAWIEGQSLGYRVEKPCCPFCIAIEITEIKPIS